MYFNWVFLLSLMTVFLTNTFIFNINTIVHWPHTRIWTNRHRVSFKLAILNNGNSQASFRTKGVQYVEDKLRHHFNDYNYQNLFLTRKENRCAFSNVNILFIVCLYFTTLWLANHSLCTLIALSRISKCQLFKH